MNENDQKKFQFCNEFKAEDESFFALPKKEGVLHVIGVYLYFDIAYPKNFIDIKTKEFIDNYQSKFKCILLPEHKEPIAILKENEQQYSLLRFDFKEIYMEVKCTRY